MDLGSDSSASSHIYKITWDASSVVFAIDGAVRRTVPLNRALAPMQLHL